MKYLFLTVATLIAAAEAQATSVLLPNGDFEATTAEVFPQGFDVPGNDVPGWTNLTPITDSGVEDVAWWNTYSGYSAFLKVGEGAYLMSSHTIQAGDVFTIGIVAKTWDAASQFTATLFFDTPTNVIGSFTSGVTPTWTPYLDSTTIAATPGSVGGTLGISIANSASIGFLNFDNVTIDVVPEPSAALLGGFGVLGLLRRRRVS